MKAKSLKKLLVIKEICSWLPPGLDGRKVYSQEQRLRLSAVPEIWLVPTKI